ncbi:UDP-N-acetylmuramoyl-tripeptide--D-alanyl-D-alanine ligase [Nitratireductor sp. B36]|uniref:UDP-N-acetylmuramoyl-tripeptide--D-alanyl-D- alanine ligase n=1 Tax=Nitratireductor sp. B36 TaxID=2762059 RepID=UPI001E40783E|nr:UDP-N-acetylmuramoyl-tripeptide--D-alanyl-D-alanine ligase [Nitratireductor sp. B36]
MRHEKFDGLSEIRTALRKGIVPLQAPFPAVVLFFSVSDGEMRARVVSATGATLEAAWQKGLAQLRQVMRKDRLEGRWLRVDWIDRAEACSWKDLRESLTRTKRNYFRCGIALDAGFHRAFLEQELNANAMLYGGNRMAHATLNEKNFARYAGAKYPGTAAMDFNDERAVFIFSTKGVFRDVDGGLHPLNEAGPDAGRRHVEDLDAPLVDHLVRSASGYLARQVGDDGAFVYGFHPCFDRRIEAYNTLRHASTTYAMLEAWEVTREATLKSAIDRSIGRMNREFIREADLPDGGRAAFLVDVGDEIKLGGNAVALLALSKYTTTTGDQTHLPLMEKLALGILYMQDRRTGSFNHVLHFPSLEMKTAFRTIYYEGEAAFGLMRLYDITRDPRWLDAVEKAFDHFIAQNHWRHHDHWLSYCVNELTRHRPEERYFIFGLQNVAGHLDFVRQRITTFPTLLELMMAARSLISRIGDFPQMTHLLRRIDLVAFSEALEFRARYLLNGFFWPETAMFFRTPNRVAGSFFIRHHAFRVRIDDVEHYLSGFIAYRNYLQLRPGFQSLVAQHSRDPADRRPLLRTSTAAIWNSSTVAEATGGHWIVPPETGWTATGLCIHAPTRKPGQMVTMRVGKTGRGIPPNVIAGMKPPPAAIITDNPQAPVPDNIPVLAVRDTGAAILALGRYARQRMSGKLLAITGSAGKTTSVAMLAHALSPYGSVAQTAHNANLPHGVAWNLASIPAATDHVVLELAVGRMGQSARMAKADVAIFTNIAPAHLSETTTPRDIAVTKSAIFEGMTSGSVAILNRDMQEWDVVHAAARARNLKILHYGLGEECEYRLINYDAQNGSVEARVNGQAVRYALGAAGEHMALNSLAILAAVAALGHPLDAALDQLASFSPLPGRGAEHRLTINGCTIHLIDDAYNANPASMRAAFANLGKRTGAGRRIAFLGEMAELGAQSRDFHTGLAPLIEANGIDRVCVLGTLYEDFWAALPDACKGVYAKTLEEMHQAFLADIRNGDIVLIKGSNSTRLHTLAGAIANIR